MEIVDYHGFDVRVPERDQENKYAGGSKRKVLIGGGDAVWRKRQDAGTRGTETKDKGDENRTREDEARWKEEQSKKFAEQEIVDAMVTDNPIRKKDDIYPEIAEDIENEGLAIAHQIGRRHGGNLIINSGEPIDEEEGEEERRELEEEHREIDRRNIKEEDRKKSQFYGDRGNQGKRRKGWWFFGRR